MTNELIFFASLIVITAGMLYAFVQAPAVLMALISLQVVLMNLFVTKQITLFGFPATSSDALGIGAILGINMLREYVGANAAKTAVIASFITVIFYTVICIIQLAYAPNGYDIQQEHLVALLQPMPRILIVSMATYLFVQMLEYYLYDYFKRKYHQKFFIARNYGVVLFTQFIDTVLFSYLGLSGLVHSVPHVIAVSYSIKAITLICMTPLLVMFKKILQRYFHVAF